MPVSRLWAALSRSSSMPRLPLAPISTADDAGSRSARILDGDDRRRFL